MSKQWTPRKTTVALEPEAPPAPARGAERVSKIRRDPPPPPREIKGLRGYPTTERETWIVVAGVILFAIAITIITFGISDYTK